MVSTAGDGTTAAVAAKRVHKDYQNQGVGSALMHTLIDVADNWLMLVRIELTVFEDNERAIMENMRTNI